MNKKQERQHHPYSPSSLQSRELCAKYQPSNNETEAALTGTMQHDVAESGNDNQRLADFKAMAVVECLKFVDERFKKHPGGKLIKEEYLPIDDEIVPVVIGQKEFLSDPADPESDIALADVTKEFLGTTAGYLDVGIISADETECEVIDFKFGKVPVEPAENNLQGMAYLLGLKKRFPKIVKATVWFLQPHIDHITYHTFTADKFGQFGAIYLRLRVVVSRARAAHANAEDYSMATPNISACLFCNLIGKCPKVAEQALKLGHKYAPLQIPDSVSTSVFTDPADVERGLKFAQVIKTWAEAYRSQATAKTIEDPDFAPKGYILVSTTKRKVVSAKKLGELAKTFLPAEVKEEVEKLYDVSIGNLEDLIKLHTVRGQKEATIEKFGEVALDAGYLEEGAPFAFLRQENTKAKKE